MIKSKKNIIGIIIFLITIITLGSFISYSKFEVINPFSTANGLIQVLFTEKEYIEIQKYPKVIISKPNFSLQDYMQNEGFQEDKENQMGALHRFQNSDTAQYVLFSTNKYFSKWRWQE